MLASPNQTVVEGDVKAIRRHPDGRGADVEVAVHRNLSPAPGTDFLRPQPGSVLTAYAAEPQGLQPGQAVRLRLTLLAGPGGGRTVVEAVEPLGD